LFSGIFLNAAALVVIFLLSIHVALAAGSAVLCVAYGVHEQLRLRRAYQRFSRLRISCDGELRLFDRQGDWQAGTLLAGSVLLRRIGWIRIRTGEGRIFAELVRGRCRYNADWRRLQVIWRHVGAVPVSC
jgi:hypothetical protein